MAFVGLESAKFSRTGNLETLGSSTVSLELRHCSSHTLTVTQNNLVIYIVAKRLSKNF